MRGAVPVALRTTTASTVPATIMPTTLRPPSTVNEHASQRGSYRRDRRSHLWPVLRLT